MKADYKYFLMTETTKIRRNDKVNKTFLDFLWRTELSLVNCDIADIYVCQNNLKDLNKFLKAKYVFVNDTILYKVCYLV